MSKYKNARKVDYVVQRNRDNGNYHVLFNNYSQHEIIRKTSSGWYAGSLYHRTLRDAIVYVLWGV